MDHLKEEERAQSEINSVNSALEKFFNNVLDCIVVDESRFKL